MSPARRIQGAGGIGLHVDTWGDPEAPTVVLVHGYPDTAAVWRPVAQQLAGEHHVVAYDVRGAGRSEAPARLAGYALDVLVDDLAAVVDGVAPAKPAYLVGHDWGSIQGWHAVCGERMVGRLRGYTSISGPCIDHVAAGSRRLPSPAQALRSWYIAAFHLPGAPAVARRAMTPARFRRTMATDGVPTDPGWPAATLPDDAARGVGLYRANMLRRLVRPDPRPATVPVQLVVPSGDRFVLPATAAVAERWASRLSRVEIDAGHWVIRSHPEAVAAAVASHLRTLPGP